MSDIADIERVREISNSIRQELKKIIVGQDDIITKVLITLFADGHLLLIGVPGLAKTLIVNSLAKAMNLDFARIQFTPDLMPADITGTDIIEENNGKRMFKFMKGPVFTNLLLADEINRTPPKTQAALLEAMQEKTVTAGGKTYPITPPFTVIATQNPIEQEGTYPLPEAELDRFMFSSIINYPNMKEEIEIVKSTTSNYVPNLNKITTREEILFAQKLLRKIPVSDSLVNFAVKIVKLTRPHKENPIEEVNTYVEWGAGPRASQYLILGAKIKAGLEGKTACEREDILFAVHPVLTHRIVLNYLSEAEGIKKETIIEKIIKTVKKEV